MDELRAFHRGSQRVLLVVGYVNGEQEYQAVFGSKETATAWMDSLPKGVVWINFPYVIDDPDWGDRQTN